MNCRIDVQTFILNGSQIILHKDINQIANFSMRSTVNANINKQNSNN